MKSQTRKLGLCRQCNTQKSADTPHQWYCKPCAETLIRERNIARNPCGAGHGFRVKCLDCNRIKATRQHEAAKRGAEKRKRNNPNFGIPQYAERLWQQRSHAAVQLAIKTRLLPDLKSGSYACADCGDVAHEYDHRDYGRPLEVEPVCRSCNRRRGTAKWPLPQEFKLVAPELAVAA